MAIQVGDRIKINAPDDDVLDGLTGTYGGKKEVPVTVDGSVSKTVLRHTILLDKPLVMRHSTKRYPDIRNELALVSLRYFELLGSDKTTSADSTPSISLDVSGGEVEKALAKPLTLGEHLRADYLSKRPTYDGQAFEWKTRGLCPRCGEKGRFSHFAFVCSKHGEY